MQMQCYPHQLEIKYSQNVLNRVTASSSTSNGNQLATERRSFRNTLKQVITDEGTFTASLASVQRFI